MRIKHRLIAMVLLLAFVGTACLEKEAKQVTVVLFDVSASTQAEEIRERYLAAFLNEVVSVIADEGGVLGVDIIDDNPQAHASLPIKEVFTGCSMLENKLECEAEIATRLESVADRAAAIVRPSSKGTDIIGGLDLASSFFDAYSEIEERQLVIFSDMVQFAHGLRFGREVPEEQAEWWSDADVVTLSGVEVYVVGAGATAPDHLDADQIAAMDSFWARYFAEGGAEVATYGSALPRFP